LNREDGRSGQFDVLEPAVFELAEDFEAIGGLLDFEDQAGVGHPEKLGEDDAGLTEAEIVGLEAGENEIGLFVANGRREKAGYAEGVVAAECGFVRALDVDGAVGAFGEGFADGLADALGAGADDDDFSAVSFFKQQGLFEGVGSL